MARAGHGRGLGACLAQHGLAERDGAPGRARVVSPAAAGERDGPACGGLHRRGCGQRGHDGPGDIDVVGLVQAAASLLSREPGVSIDALQARTPGAPVPAYGVVRVARRPPGSLASAATVPAAAPASARPLASLASPSVCRARSLRW